LLEVASPIDQPVDNFMAWQVPAAKRQGRAKVMGPVQDPSRKGQFCGL